MTLLDQYVTDGRIRFNINADDVEVVADADDYFSISYYNKQGQPVIMSVQRNTEVFWRNRAEGL